MQLKSIDQQVVAVVGASSGIGRETALKFGQRGAKLVVAARSESGLNSLVEEIRQGGGEAISIVADVSNFEAVKAIAEQAVAQYGRLDTLVHAAATGVLARFDQITPEEFERVIQVNLMGQVYGAMAALPHLKREGRGALIHVSSMEGRRSLPGRPPAATVDQRLGRTAQGAGRADRSLDHPGRGLRRLLGGGAGGAVAPAVGRHDGAAVAVSSRTPGDGSHPGHAR